MEDLSGDVRIDARAVVDQLRALVESTRDGHPRTWLPQATFDELLIRANRDPIHFHPALHHLHHRWDMTESLKPVEGGRGPKAFGRRLFAKAVNMALSRYLAEEQDFRASLARSIDAIAYRVDEVASADLRAMLEIIRKDMLELSHYVDDRIDDRIGER